MRKEFLADVRADVDRLGELWRKIDWLYENATDNLDVLKVADAEDDGTELDYLLAISTGIRQAMDECAAFDAHFRRKYGAKEEEKEAPRIKSELYQLAENDVKMLDALAARIESRRAEAHKALAGMTACEDPTKEEKYGLMAADALGSAASTCMDFYVAVTMMAELAAVRDAVPKGAKLTRTILQRSIAHAVKNTQGAVKALSASATSDRTKSVIDGFRKAFLDTEEGEA